MKIKLMYFALFILVVTVIQDTVRYSLFPDSQPFDNVFWYGLVCMIIGGTIITLAGKMK